MTKFYLFLIEESLFFFRKHATLLASIFMLKKNEKKNQRGVSRKRSCFFYWKNSWNHCDSNNNYSLNNIMFRSNWTVSVKSVQFLCFGTLSEEVMLGCWRNVINVWFCFCFNFLTINKIALYYVIISILHYINLSLFTLHTNLKNAFQFYKNIFNNTRKWK